jgi:hypothetical protein
VSRGPGPGFIGHRDAQRVWTCAARLFSRDRMGMVFGSWCLEVMDHAAHYRDRASHVRELADAAWQPDLKDMLRGLAKDYDEVADDIEDGATEIRHAELLNG